MRSSTSQAVMSETCEGRLKVIDVQVRVACPYDRTGVYVSSSFIHIHFDLLYS